MKKIGVILCLLVCFLPGSADAYFATLTGERKLSEKMGVFSIQYEFGHKDFSLTLPTVAVRSTSTTDKLGFTMMEDEGLDITEDGVATGYILSTTDIVDGHYVVPAGSRASFTLLVVHTITHERTEDYALKVQSLPFTLGDNNNALRNAELRHYRTESIILNESATD